MTLELLGPALPGKQSPLTKRSAVRSPPGRTKAAVLLGAVGLDGAAEVFRHLREDEIESLSLEMAQLSRVDATTIDTVLEEFVATVQAHESLIIGGVEYAHDVLERALGPERAVEIIGRMSSVMEKRPFEFLRDAPADRIIGFLRDESPSTIALIIASLHSVLAAQVFSGLPESDQPDIAERIARIGEVSPDIIRQVEEGFRRKLSSVIQDDFSAPGGTECLAEVLKHSELSTERLVVDALAERDDELAADIRRLLFSFEDIIKLDDRSIQLVLREADHKDLALALRGASDGVRERILANLSARGAQALVEEMTYLPPQRKRVVEAAQGEIVGIVRRLEDAGDLIVARSDDDIIL